MTKRNYNYKNVDMLTGAKVVVQHFKEHQAEIIAMRSSWADPYITDLESKIDNAITNYLGLDVKQAQRLATQSVYGLQETALKKLSFFKVNIEADYSKDKDRLNFLLTSLGFNSHHVSARTGNQESLIQLLQQFKLNMTPEIMAEITSKGTSPDLITEIIELADPLKEADVAQETLKTSSKTITEEAQNEFNAIYDEVMSIGKISSKLFESEPIIKEKFTFSRIMINLGAGSSNNSEKSNDTDSDDSDIF